MTEEEGKEEGGLSWSTYHGFIMAMGGYIIAISGLLSYVFVMGIVTFNNWWLSLWLNQGNGTVSLLIFGFEDRRNVHIYTDTGMGVYVGVSFDAYSMDMIYQEVKSSYCGTWLMDVPYGEGGLYFFDDD